MISVLLRIIINLENLTPATQDLSEIDDMTLTCDVEQASVYGSIQEVHPTHNFLHS